MRKAVRILSIIVATFFVVQPFSYNYTKTISLSNSSLNVSDRYDYASGDYTGVAGVAVNTMYQAQQAGILVPYYVKINVNPNSLIWL